MKLLTGYLRRKQFEAKLSAVTMAKVLFGGDKQEKRVSADEMMSMMGATWQ